MSDAIPYQTYRVSRPFRCPAPTYSTRPVEEELLPPRSEYFSFRPPPVQHSPISLTFSVTIPHFGQREGLGTRRKEKGFTTLRAAPSFTPAHQFRP